MTSTGTGVSTAVRDVRAPTTTTSLRESGVAVSLKSTVTVCPAGTTTRCSAASCPMSRARTVWAPAGTLRRYCPFSLVRTLRAVPTITTLAPASGAPDSVATTVPETLPACCATSGTKQTANRNAAFRAAGVDLTGHLLEDDGVADPGVASNTPPGVGALPVADRSHPGLEREPLELFDRQRQQQVDPTTQEQEGILERRPLRGVVARDQGRIRHAPMSHDRLAGEDRARLLRAVAHRDHEVPGLPFQPVDAAWGPASPRGVVFTQRLDRVRIHPIGGA